MCLFLKLRLHVSWGKTFHRGGPIYLMKTKADKSQSGPYSTYNIHLAKATFAFCCGKQNVC